MLPLLVKSGSLETLTSLLSHENSDIADTAIKVLGELIDIDNSASEDDIRLLTDDLLTTHNLGTVLTQFLETREASDDLDAESVADALRMVENLTTLGRESVVNAFYRTNLFKWLLRCISSSTVPTTIRHTCAELIATILVTSPRFANLIVTSVDGVDILLTALAPVRMGVRKGSDEEGFFRDLLSSLQRCLRSEVAHASFIANEGIELMFLLISESKSTLWLRQDALRVLVDSLKGHSGSVAATKIAQGKGLKRLFSMLTLEKSSKKQATLDDVLQILALLLRWIELDSWPRKKMVLMFTAHHYAKLKVVLTLRDEAMRSLTEQFGEFGSKPAEDEDLDEETRLLNDLQKEELQLKAGKERLRHADVIWGWLALQYGEIEQQVTTHFGVSTVPTKVLREYRDKVQEFLDIADREDPDQVFEWDEAKLTVDMLTEVINVLESPL